MSQTDQKTENKRKVIWKNHALRLEDYNDSKSTCPEVRIIDNYGQYLGNFVVFQNIDTLSPTLIFSVGVGWSWNFLSFLGGVEIAFSPIFLQA